MGNISDAFFKERTLLVNVNREGCINAAFVTHNVYGKYDWLADADITNLQLSNFQAILGYLQHTGSNLEISYLNSAMSTAKITILQREGGYKEPFHRVVQYSCEGYECLKELEKILSTQLNSEKQKSDSFDKRLTKQMVPSKHES